VSSLPFAALLLAASALTRLPGADGSEIVVSGVDKAQAIIREHRYVFTGAPVKLVRGDATLTCRKLTAQQNAADEFQWATCEGEVKFVRGDRSITCEKATYDDPAARLTCEGHPELRSGKTVLSGDKLVYDLARDEAQLSNMTGHGSAEGADEQLKKRDRAGEKKP
jgi:lipopolysaccharide export system protein LptA